MDNEKPFNLKVRFSDADQVLDFAFATEGEREAFEAGLDHACDQFPEYPEYTEKDLEGFKTQEEKRAFGQGVEQGDGWSRYELIDQAL